MDGKEERGPAERQTMDKEKQLQMKKEEDAARSPQQQEKGLQKQLEKEKPSVVPQERKLDIKPETGQPGSHARDANGRAGSRCDSGRTRTFGWKDQVAVRFETRPHHPRCRRFLSPVLQRAGLICICFSTQRRQKRPLNTPPSCFNFAWRLEPGNLCVREPHFELIPPCQLLLLDQEPQVELDSWTVDFLQ